MCRVVHLLAFSVVLIGLWLFESPDPTCFCFNSFWLNTSHPTSKYLVCCLYNAINLVCILVQNITELLLEDSVEAQNYGMQSLILIKNMDLLD